MSRALSLHIGVNEVDSKTYGAVPKLQSAVKDAEDMQKIAEGLQYEQSTLLRDSEATARNVLEKLGQMAQDIEQGGVCFITYAGHGSQVPDTTGDEPSGKDQTWVLYDRMLIDDELFAMWKRFASGVTIYFVSDSCHSGSAARFFDIETFVRKNQPQFILNKRNFGDVSDVRDRQLPPDAALLAYEKYEEQITTSQWICGKRNFSDLMATVISFGACQDEETSGDGANNGIFTAALKIAWNNGTFSGTPKEFLEKIAAKVSIYQHPRFETFGASNSSALLRTPFIIPPVSRVTAGEWGEGTGKGWGGDWRDFSYSGNVNNHIDFGSRSLTDESLIQCKLDIPTSLTASISPEQFDISLKTQLADALSMAYRQVHSGIAANPTASILLKRRDFSYSGGVQCTTSGNGVSCTGGLTFGGRF
jgi:hypothetical protein